MEGNLTRARSIRMSTSSSSPSPSSLSGKASPLGPHQPVGGLYRSISRTDRKFSPLRPRPTYISSLASQDVSSNRHSRVQSENNLAPQRTSETEHLSRSASVSRSASAMGSDTTSFRNNNRLHRYAGSKPYLFWPAHSALHPSDWESEELEAKKDSPPLAELPESESTEYDKPKISNVEDFNAVHPSHGLTRTQSQLQVGGLRDQVKGLHVRVSSLKEKTLEDSVRRHSVQNLRSVSNPLAPTAPWYANVTDNKAIGTNQPNKAYTPSDVISEYAREASQGDEGAGPGKEDISKTTSATEPPESPVVDGDEPKRRHFEMPGSFQDDDNKSLLGSVYEDAEGEESEEYGSDGLPHSETDSQVLDDVLENPFADRFSDEDEVEDSSSTSTFPERPESRPHEEREDAFDYEHFILQSALGNYSQPRSRTASDSSSTSSTATTRPTYDQTSAAEREIERSRAGSAASMSTVATFATAMEGDEDDEDGSDLEDVLYWDKNVSDGKS